MAMQSWSDAIVDTTLPQPFYIAKVEKIHPELRFTAIPLLCDEIEEVEDKITGVTGKQRTAVLVDVIVKQMKSWSLKAPITVDNVRRMRRPMIVKAYEMIAIQRPSDPDPQNDGAEVPQDQSIEAEVGKS